MHVNSLTSFFEMCTVCKRFRRILWHPVMLMWFTVRLREPSKLVHLEFLGSRIRSIQFTYASNESFEGMLLPPTLTSLNLRFCRLGSRGLARALRGLNRLTDVNVDGCFNLENVSALMHLPLKTLTLGSGHRDHFWDADKVLPTLPYLRTLNLNSLGLCTDIFDRAGTESPCVAAMARLHNLHTLILDGTDLHDREFAKLEPLSATLRTLCVSDTEITDQSAGVLSRFTMLEYLSVESCKLSKPSLYAIAGLVNLRALYACNCPRMVRDASFSAISALGQLETLDISFNPVRRFEPLYALRYLRSLDVTECNRSCSDGSAVSEDECDIEEVARRALCDRLPGLVIRYVDRHADVRALSIP